MPRFYVVLALAVLSLLGSALGQPSVTGRVVEVRVEGTTTYADIVRTIITSRVGTPLEGLDLEAERSRIYSLGTFESVSLALQPQTGGAALVIRVSENPRIGEVELEGVTDLDQAALLATLASAHLLEPGRVYNTIRASEGVATLRQAYRQAGYPFDVGIDLFTEIAPDLAEDSRNIPIRLIYSVDESAVVDRVVYSGNTVMTDSELDALFRGIREADAFDPQLYRQTVQAVGLEYMRRGYRGSGVDAAATQLVNGVLDVRIRELTIASIDTTALGVDPGRLTLKPGDLFDYDLLLADVKRLARGRSSDIQLQAEMSATGGVRVTFRVGAPESAGPVSAVRFEGNTVLSDAELLEVLNLEVGDTFTSVVAQEDFNQIVRAYQEAGYRVLTTPDFSYDDGTYIQRVTELRVAGYRVVYDGESGSTQDHVVVRYLPPVGEVLNDQDLVAGLLDVARLGVLDVVSYQLDPTDAVGEALVSVIVRKRSTGVFRPSAQYATDSGISAALSYSEKNFLGLAHSVSAEVNVLSTDIGVMFGGRLSYDIPWLYIAAGDFQEVPTSISASLFSVVANNTPLTANGQTTTLYPGTPDLEDNYVRVGEYTTRSSGFGVTVGRPIAPDTAATVALNAVHSRHMLEPPKVACEFEGGNVANPDDCFLPESEALSFLPTSGLSAFLNVRLGYDGRDSPDFPTEGLAAYGTVGVGFGNDFLDPVTTDRRTYVYEQVTFGVRAYVKLADLMPAEIEDENHVFAVKLDGGHQFGGLYPASKRFLVGRTSDVASQIRGYQRNDFNLSRSYAIGSLEYRYDFELSTVATETVVGIVFADLGWASSVPGFDEYRAPLFAGAGIGVQVNLGFGGVVLPAIRLDYGISERNRSGVFSVRLGPVY